MIFGLFRFFSLRSHPGEHTRGDQCAEGGSLGDYTGLDELRVGTSVGGEGGGCGVDSRVSEGDAGTTSGGGRTFWENDM